MKVRWQKTYYQHGELEVPDAAGELVQQKLVENAAADQDIIPGEMDWGGTQFFSPNPQYDGDVAAMEDAESQDKFYEWFDVD